jgi:hypothetical protein
LSPVAGFRGADAVVLSRAARPTVVGQRRSTSVAAGSVSKDFGNRDGVSVSRFDLDAAAGVVRFSVARFVGMLAVVPRVAAARLAGAVRAGFVAARLVAAGFAATFPVTELFATAFLVAAFFGTTFFVATFFAATFFDATFFAGAFFDATFFDATFFATGFLAAAFLVACLAGLAVLRATAFLPAFADAPFAFPRALPLPAVPRFALPVVFAVAMRLSSPVMFEVLHFTFVPFRGGVLPESAGITSFVLRMHGIPATNAIPGLDSC